MPPYLLEVYQLRCSEGYMGPGSLHFLTSFCSGDIFQDIFLHLISLPAAVPKSCSGIIVTDS